MEGNVIKNPRAGGSQKQDIGVGEGRTRDLWDFKKLYAYITLLKIEIEFTKENISTKTTGYFQMIVMKAANI